MTERNDIPSLLPGGAMLAPMLDITDIPFRKLCRAFGATVSLTEMVSAIGILRDAPDSYRYAAFSPDEQPIILQLVVADPRDVEPALAKLLPFRPAQININSGCPDKHICSAGAGADLLDDLRRLEDVVRETVRVSGLPVSVKVRARGRKRTGDVRDVVRAVENGGAAWAIVHGRNADTSYATPATWEDIAAAKDAVSIPIIGNGDAFSSALARDMVLATSCDGVMIGRGALGAPWIFRDIAEGRACRVEESAPSREEMHALVLAHFREIVREYGEFRAVSKMRKHALWYARFFRDWETLRHEVFLRDDARGVLEVADAFFAESHDAFDPGEEDAKTLEQKFQKKTMYWM